MITERQAHTATLLADATVLVTGGRSPDFVGPELASAELYDPAGGSWSASGDMLEARRLHSATLLNDGRVLVAGGIGGNGQLTSAELYDPSSATWTVTGGMRAAREFHTATLLTNGLVLAAGGSGTGGSQRSAELYDPGTGTWIDVGNMIDGRHRHTATLLPGGRVLVAGGIDRGGSLASAELYDPVTRSWSATGSMAAGREIFTATPLADGRVLVVGGCTCQSDGTVRASAELFDPTLGSWTSTGGLNHGRWLHTATMLNDGGVLVTGGVGSSGGNYSLSSAEIYAP